MVQVPAFGRMADVCCVEQQGQGFGLVDANEENRKKKTTTSIHLFSVFLFFFLQIPGNITSTKTLISF